MKTLILPFIVLVFVSFTMACGQKTNVSAGLAPQEPCGFIQTDQKQRVGLKSKIEFSEDQAVPEEFNGAIRDAMDVWNKALGKTIFSLGQRIDQNTADSEQVNSIMWVTEWPADKSDMEAETTLAITGAEIKNAHIKINALKYVFSTDLKAGTLDIESILIHELGHALGLKHDPSEDSVMFMRLSEATPRRDLSPSDLAHLKCQYN